MRFEIYEADLVEEAKEEDGKDSTKYQREGLRELDLIINGITIHNDKYQRSRGTEIALVQMYYTLTSLGDGGMALVVMNAILTFRTLQQLVVLLNLFQSCTAVKPIAIYTIRKSFLVFCKGFQKARLDNWNLTETLRKILTGHRNHSGEKAEEYYKDIYFLGDQYAETHDNLTIAKSLVDKWGDAIIQMLNPVWERQKEVIQQVMKGRKWMLCDYRVRCRNGVECPSAHSEDELIPIIRDRLKQLGEI